MDDVSALVAVASAIVTVLVTAVGVYERRRAFRAEQDWRQESASAEKAERERNFKAQQSELEGQAARWRQEFEAARSRQEVVVRKDFLLEQYRYRLASYSPVLTTLGTVSDSDLRRAPQGFEELRTNPETLVSTATALLQHLYGQAGLLMTMQTRGVIHDAAWACHRYLSSEPGQPANDDLADAFYWARRYLRADLELLDDRSAENLQSLVDALGHEPSPTEGATSTEDGV